MRNDQDSLCAAYKERVDTKENRSIIRNAMTVMNFEEMIDFVIFSAQAAFKDGVLDTLNALEEKQ